MSATAMEKPSAYEKLGLREKIGYGMGDAGSGMIWSVLALYLTWFYTDVYGLNAGVVGTLFLVIRIFDAFSDPLMGAICDRTVSRWGKFRPWRGTDVHYPRTQHERKDYLCLGYLSGHVADLYRD